MFYKALSHLPIKVRTCIHFALIVVTSPFYQETRNMYRNAWWRLGDITFPEIWSTFWKFSKLLATDVGDGKGDALNYVSCQVKALSSAISAVYEDLDGNERIGIYDISSSVADSDKTRFIDDDRFPLEFRKQIESGFLSNFEWPQDGMTVMTCLFKDLYKHAHENVK